MSDIKMGNVISKIKNSMPGPSLLQRIVRAVKQSVAKVTWFLWGRKKAFRRMQKLALSAPVLYSNEYYPVKAGTIESNSERHKTYVIRQDSLKMRDPLPEPDVDDSGLN